MQDTSVYVVFWSPAYVHPEEGPTILDIDGRWDDGRKVLIAASEKPFGLNLQQLCRQVCQGAC